MDRSSHGAQQQRDAYIAARWEQLNDLRANWGKRTTKHLLLVNIGVLAGSLSFISAISIVKLASWPKITLLFFGAGLTLMGLYHMARYGRTEWLFREWRSDARRYANDWLTWNDLIDRDDRRSKKWALFTPSLTYLSFGCFLAGTAIAAFNFSDVGNSAKTIEATQRPSDPQATSNGPDTARPGQGARVKHGNARPPINGKKSGRSPEVMVRAKKRTPNKSFDAQAAGENSQ